MCNAVLSLRLPRRSLSWKKNLAAGRKSSRFCSRRSRPSMNKFRRNSRFRCCMGCSSFCSLSILLSRSRYMPRRLPLRRTDSSGKSSGIGRFCIFRRSFRPRLAEETGSFLNPSGRRIFQNNGCHRYRNWPGLRRNCIW